MQWQRRGKRGGKAEGYDEERGMTRGGGNDANSDPGATMTQQQPASTVMTGGPNDEDTMMIMTATTAMAATMVGRHSEGDNEGGWNLYKMGQRSGPCFFNYFFVYLIHTQGGLIPP